MKSPRAASVPARGLRHLAIAGASLAAVAGLLLPAALAAEEAPGATEPPARELLLVAGAGAGEVALVDAACGQVMMRVRLDGAVGAVATSRDGRRVFVAHVRTGPASRRATLFTAIDLATGSQVVRADLGPYGRVTDLWTSHDGVRVWLAVEDGGRVLTVNSTTGKLLQIWDIGTPSSQEGAVSPSDRLLFVTNRRAGTLTIIDRVTIGARTVSLAPGLTGVAHAPRQPEVWVANAERSTVTVLRGAGDVVATLPSGGSRPLSVHFVPDGTEVWILHAGGRGSGDGSIEIFRSRDREHLATIPLPGRPRQLRFAAGGRRAFVTIPDHGAILPVDARERALGLPLSPGLTPTALAWAGCGPEGCGPAAGAAPSLGPDGLPVSYLSDEEIIGGLAACRPGTGRRGRALRRDVGAAAPESGAVPGLVVSETAGLEVVSAVPASGVVSGDGRSGAPTTPCSSARSRPSSASR